MVCVASLPTVADDDPSRGVIVYRFGSMNLSKADTSPYQGGPVAIATGPNRALAIAARPHGAA